MRTTGFGFIKPDSGGDDDIFFHWSAIHRVGDYRTLEEGVNVEFEIHLKDDERPRASTVTTLPHRAPYLTETEMVM